MPREKACHIEVLLHSATSAVERGIAENEAGDLALAASAGELATRAGTDLHTTVSTATDLKADAISELDGVAINAQQIGIFLATRTQIEDEAVGLKQGLQGMRDATEGWTQRLRDAGVVCP